MEPVLPTADSGVSPIRSKADLRDFVHRAVATIVTILGTYQVAWADANGSVVTAWIPAVLGVVDAALSYGNATDIRRKVIYAVAGIAQLALVAVGVATQEQALLIIGFATATLNSVYASQWTVTTVASGRHAK